MEKSNVYTSLKNWPCYLKKAYEDESTTIYVDDFNGFSIFVYVQQGGKILIQADNGTIISNYVKNVCKSTVIKDSGDRVCKWCFGKDHVIFRLKESGEMYVSSNKIELVNLYCEPENLEKVEDFLNRC
ncbi:MAG: hypothetical protein KHW86_10970 [Porphyromonadaceae bacterium]|nr:hypothetical protein [Porphyromonadaceae bacterium]MDY5487958.1 hypothetical protein [Butyricimonas virosa]